MKQRGFTFIEMMATLVVVGIGVAMAIPAYSTWTARNQLASATNLLTTGLTYARSEAIRRNGGIAIRGGIEFETDWSRGWTVWADSNGDCRWSPGEEVLRVEEARPGQVATVGTSPCIRFSGRGTVARGDLSSWRTTFRVCAEGLGQTDNARKLKLLPGGQVVLHRAGEDCGGMVI